MASDKWEFDTSVKRYRSTETGRFLSNATMTRLREDFLSAQRVVTEELARRLADGEITVQRWQAEMRAVVKATFGGEYLFGRGGRNAMTAGDWGSLGPLVRDQYRYLHAFAERVAAGELTQAQIAARAGLYCGASVQAYERGRGAAYGLTLPVYPADGGTSCKANCRCSWRIEETDSEWRATWKLSAAENCAGCQERARQYAPLVVAKEAA